MKWDGKTAFQLYDMKHDPLELHDLAAQEPARVAKLLKRCRRHWSLFISYEKHALKGFEEWVEKGRALTPAQQLWLVQIAGKAREAARAAKREAEEEQEEEQEEEAAREE